MSRNGEAENEEARAREASEMSQTTEKLHRMYKLRLRRLVDIYEYLCRIPFDLSLRAMNREVLNTVGLKISEQANLIRLRHMAGRLDAREAKEFMDATFDLLVEFITHVRRSMSNAGITLGRAICESLTELTECTLYLLQATIGYGSHGSPEGRCSVPDLALKVMAACESLVKKPKTNSAAIQEAIVQVGNDIEGALHEMKKKAGPSTGGSYGTEASTSKSDGKREAGVEDGDSLYEERKVTELAIRVVFDTVPVIEELKDIVASWKDVNIRGLSTHFMEGLLLMAIKTRKQVFKIKDSMFPLRVVDVLRVLRGMAIVTYMEQKLEPYRYGVEDFYQKLYRLRDSMQDLKRVLKLMAPSSSCVGLADLADDLHGLSMSR